MTKIRLKTKLRMDFPISYLPHIAVLIKPDGTEAKTDSFFWLRLRKDGTITPYKKNGLWFLTVADSERLATAGFLYHFKTAKVLWDVEF